MALWFFFWRGSDALLGYLLFWAGVVFCLAALISPAILTPFNQAWMTLGKLMGLVISPLVLGAMFFLLITPIAVVGRLTGRDSLRLKKTEGSHWIIRDPAGPDGDSFRNQF